VEVVASLSQGRTAAAQCGLFTYKSAPVIFEPPCSSIQVYCWQEWRDVGEYVPQCTVVHAIKTVGLLLYLYFVVYESVDCSDVWSQGCRFYGGVYFVVCNFYTELLQVWPAL